MIAKRDPKPDFSYELKRQLTNQDAYHTYDGDDEDDDEVDNGLVLGTLRWKDNKIIVSETYYGMKNPVEINSFEDLKKLLTKRLLKAKK